MRLQNPILPNSKFAQTGTVRLTPLAAVNVVVTDTQTPA